MKKILIFILMTSALFAKGEIKNNKVLIELKNGITLNFSLAEGDYLRIKALKPNSEEKENKYFIEKKQKIANIVKKGNKFLINELLIEEGENSYTLYKGEKALYKSKFYIDKKGKLIEDKTCLEQELLYGMGEAANKLPLISTVFNIWQVSKYGDQADLHIPFYFSSGGDSFYYNANPNDFFKFRRIKDAQCIVMTKNNIIDYYYNYEKDLKILVSKFYNFSESKSLIPKWAFGLLQSKYGYKNIEEVYELILKFKGNDIPVSAVILDLYWFKHMGDLDWDLEKWKNFKKMDAVLEKNNVKLITISEPFFTKDSKNYKEFTEKGLFAKRKDGSVVKWSDWWCFGSEYGSIVNPIAKNAYSALGDKYVEMKKNGIDGFWTDLGEPEKTPQEAYFNEYTEKEFHNYYNYEWSKLIYNRHNEEFPNERLFMLSRSGYTGSAKFNISVWSGDSSSSFTALKKQIAIGLNAGLAGFSYWGSDVGGFISGEKKTSKELYIRWMQFGAFSPVFRPHGAMSSREPWIYDEDTTKLMRKYIKMRYELMPYIYSSAYETYLNGIPMMRPMFFYHQEDKKALKQRYQYYFGDSILVAPVLDSIKRKKEKKIYLPAGTWYDYYTMEKLSLKEGKEFKIESNLEKLPLYIKEGAIIPKEKEILIVPSEKEIRFTLFNDDGVTNDYLKGEYEKVDIRFNKKQIIFKGVIKEREITLKILKEGFVLTNLKDYEEDDKFYIIKINLRSGHNKIIF